MKKMVSLIIICLGILLVHCDRSEALLIDFESINVESANKFSVDTAYGKANFNASVGNTLEDVLVSDHTLRDSIDFSGHFWKNTAFPNQMVMDLDFESSDLSLWFHGRPKDEFGKSVGLFVDMYDKDGNLAGGLGRSGTDPRWDTFDHFTIFPDGNTFNKLVITFIDPRLNGGSHGNDIGIDDISLTPVGITGTVPEPSTVILLSGGLAGAFLRRRIKNAGN